MSTSSLSRFAIGLSIALGIIALGLLFFGFGLYAAYSLFAGLTVAAIGAQMLPSIRTYAFALWVLSFVVAAMIWPEWFKTWGGYPGKSFVPLLIQIAMFGMGATLTIADFTRVFRMPKAVLAGVVLQYTVMPLTGWAIAYALRLPPEIAAGVILVGACPGGVSSNVITFLAKGNVALSVTMTACSTLLSPIATPLMMKLLAGAIIEVNAYEMMLSILWIVIAPIVAGWAANSILAYFRWSGPWVDQVLTIISMVAICFICAIIAADSRDPLLTVGWLLVLAVALHNTLGYLLGYWGSRAIGLDESACRTVAIEVGLQNGGMAASLATSVLKSSQAALAAAIFAPWMNATGSILAAWWRSRPTEDTNSQTSSK